VSLGHHMGRTHDRDQERWVPVVVLHLRWLFLACRVRDRESPLRMGSPHTEDPGHGSLGGLG